MYLKKPKEWQMLMILKHSVPLQENAGEGKGRVEDREREEKGLKMG